MKFSRFFSFKSLCLALAAVCLLAAGPALAAKDGAGEPDGYALLGPVHVPLYPPPGMARIDQTDKKYDEKLREMLPGYNGLVAIYADAASWAEFKKAVNEGREPSLEFYAYAATLPKGPAPMMELGTFQWLRDAIKEETQNYQILETGDRDLIYKETFSDEAMIHLLGHDQGPEADPAALAELIVRNPDDHVVFNMLVHNRQMLFYVCADKSRGGEVMPLMRKWRQIYLDRTKPDAIFDDEDLDKIKEVPTFDSFGPTPPVE